MRTVTAEQPVSEDDPLPMAAERLGNLVKAVVDLGRELMLVSAELHADEESERPATGSRQQDLWGINLYPHLSGKEWTEFAALINLRPSFGNHSRGVDDPAIHERVVMLVGRLVRR